MEHCALKGAAEHREPQDTHLGGRSFFNNTDEPEDTSGYVFQGVSFKLKWVPVIR